jgi:hypothetical protein
MISERRFPRPESDEKTPRGASLLSMYVPNPRDASLMHNQIHPCLMILKLSLVSPTGLPQVPGAGRTDWCSPSQRRPSDLLDS